MTSLDHYRAQKDAFFKIDPHSPLTTEQQAVFVGLRYFPENPALRLVLQLEEFAAKDRIEMQTSTGDTQVYSRYGRLAFMVDGQNLSLTLFADQESGTFFLPFTDALKGRETYGAGRYLDAEPLGNHQFLIDFNLAYNPYCAYNDDWSCPVAPVENRLPVPIRAGEKVFDEHGELVSRTA